MTAYAELLEFCLELNKRHITYQMMVDRPEAVMLMVAVPGERWEIEFFYDGRIEVEKFISRGVEDGSGAIEELLGYYES